jgi:hypothetical protein
MSDEKKCPCGCGMKGCVCPDDCKGDCIGKASGCSCGCAKGKCKCKPGCKCGCNHKKGGASWAQKKSFEKAWGVVKG